MARPTMAALITRVREIINDPVGSSQVFRDEQVQAALDRHRTEVRYADLHPEPTYTAAGVTYLDFYFLTQGERQWEDTVQLYKYNYSSLTADSQDLVSGRFSFSAHTDAPVYIKGQLYDLYAAAVDLIEDWCSKVKFEFLFLDNGQSFHLEDKIKNLRNLAETFRSRIHVRSIPFSNSTWYR